jgi:hypothetical protein
MDFPTPVQPAGSIWMIYLALYALGRFMIQFIRLDPPKLFGLQEAHLIAILVMAVTVPFIVWKTRFKSAEEAKPGEPKSGERKPGEPKPKEGRVDRRERRARERVRARERERAKAS